MHVSDDRQGKTNHLRRGRRRMSCTYSFSFLLVWCVLGDSCLKYRSKAMPRCRHAVICFFVLWTIDAQASQTALCPVLALPRHGYLVSNYCERVAGSFCGIGCLTGYRLITGDSYRECQADGLWSGHEPSCTGLIVVDPLSMVEMYVRVCRDSLSWFDHESASYPSVHAGTE